MERLWDTLQKRLPPLLRTNGMTTMEAANRWLAEVYLEQHNARFAVAAAEEGTAFIPFVGELDNILCIEEERVAALDNTVRYEGRRLQIPPNRNRHHFAKSTIRVLEYWNGAIALFHGPREIARFRCRRDPERKDRRPRKSLSREPASRRACGRRGQLRGQTARTCPPRPQVGQKPKAESPKADI